MMLHLILSLMVGLAGVEIGDLPSHRFAQPLFNGMGAESLEDLRGKPVLVEFWGRKAAAVDDTMREVLAWQEAYGEDLSVLFVETKQATELQVVSLALKKKWLGGAALWTTEAPFRVGLRGALPQFVLLSGEGTVLLKGTTESMELGYRNELVERIEAELQAEIRRRRSGPEGLEPELVAAYEDFAEGRIGKALELARALASDPAPPTAAAGTLATLRERLGRRLERAAWQIENGFLIEAERELERLEGHLAGEACEERHVELTAALREESLAPEWKAARDLADLERKLYSKGPTSVLVKQLERLAKKHAGTHSAERASFLLEAARVSPYE